jgi:hypothetical protein
LEPKYEVTRAAVQVGVVELSEEESANLKRPEMPAIPVEERAKSFKEVELGFSEAAAIAEARRCLRCDLEKKE